MIEYDAHDSLTAPPQVAHARFMILPALVSLSLAASPAPQTYAKPEAALEKGALLLERRDEDLDGDGVAEAILAAGIPDPDGEPVSRGSAFNGTIAVHVLQRSGERWREVGRIELEGVPEPIAVADVGESAEQTRLLVTGADHCGASCNGMELHTHALKGGRLVAYLPEETKAWNGWVTVVPGKFVETWTRAESPARSPSTARRRLTSPGLCRAAGASSR